MKTIAIHGSADECLVQFGGPGEFIRGRRVNIKVRTLQEDENGDTPLPIRQAMVERTFSTVLTAEQVIKQCGEQFQSIMPLGTRLAYAHEVVQVLRDAGLDDPADQLEKLAPDILDVYGFPKECYTLE